jgi:hypothetical protein
MIVPVGFGLVQVALCLAGLIVGVRGARRSAHLPGMALAAAIGVGFGVLARIVPTFGEPTNELGGVLLAVLGLGVGPQTACHWLGYRIGKRYPDSPERRRGAIVTSLIMTGLVVVPVSFVIAIESYALVVCPTNQDNPYCPYG